jgi:ATP/maltotriose-dependent transcriptional regulator MalT
VAAGRALWLGGQSARAVALLDDVLPLVREPVARADIALLRGAAGTFIRPVSETSALLAAEAEAVEGVDSSRAAAILVSAAYCCFMAGELERSVETARRAVQAASGRADGTLLVARVSLGLALSLRGEVGEGLGLLDASEALLDAVDPLGETALLLGAVAQTLVHAERWDVARRMLGRLIEAARTAGAPTFLPYPLAALSELELRQGRLAPAYAAAAESTQLAEETGQFVEATYSLVTLARVEAVLGHAEACRAHVATALERSRRLGVSSTEPYAAATLGLLELSLGNPEQAATSLSRAAADTLRFGLELPTCVQFLPDLVEAHLRRGEVEAARTALATLERQAGRTGLRWPAATAARCRGLLAGDDAYEEELAAALALHGDLMPFERARTLLCLGMRRRRSRRRGDARTVLHEALAFFEHAGAEPWAEQARAELRASGEAPAPSPDGTLRPLTPQELQVALVVADGATNKEAAAALFLSPKTVEFHLRNTYRKLGVRSRAQLVRAVAGDYATSARAADRAGL